jgi:hypothetical protein
VFSLLSPCLYLYISFIVVRTIDNFYMTNLIVLLYLYFVGDLFCKSRKNMVRTAFNFSVPVFLKQPCLSHSEFAVAVSSDWCFG